MEGLLAGIQAEVRKGNYRFTLHAGDKMTERHISAHEVREAILSNNAEIIEDYPEDTRGPSCLILGMTSNGQPLHVQCSYPPNIAIITAYEPEPTEWLDLRTRKGRRQ